MPNRLLITETCDPDGAMFRCLSPDVSALGWHVRRLPSQDAIHHLGHTGYQRLVVRTCEELRPHVLLVHPPYDHLSSAAAERIRELGTRLVAFGFDDPIVRLKLEPAGTWLDYLRDADARYDLYTSTDPETVAAAVEAGCTGIRYLRWAASPAAFETGAAGADSALELDSLAESAVLVGRAYPNRVELVTALARAGLPVAVLGSGWTSDDVTQALPTGVTPHGYVPGAELPAVLGAAGVVISPADWGTAPAPMVKYRLLEAAFAGACQLAQRAPGLSDYFDADQVPDWGDVAELTQLCVSLLSDADRRTALATASQARAEREHTWAERWPELLGLLADVGRPLNELPAHQPAIGLDTCLMMLAHDAERVGRVGLATELFGDLVAEHPDDASGLAGLARLGFSAGRSTEAAVFAERALVAGADLVPGPPLHVRLDATDAPFGLGRTGFLRPDCELTAYRIAALAQVGAVEEALAVVEGIDSDDALVTIASLLQPDERGESAPIWRRLFERALAAEPVQQAELKAERDVGWKEMLAALGR